jgi:anti-anti-sigma factor
MTGEQREEHDPSNPPASGSTAAVGVDILITRMHPWTIVVSLVGEHDVTTAASFERLAVDQLDRCDRLVIDLSQVVFVDSSVINAFVRVARQARPRGVTFQVVAAPGSHVHRVLGVMGLLDHLGCIEDVPETPAARSATANGTLTRADDNGASATVPETDAPRAPRS